MGGGKNQRGRGRRGEARGASFLKSDFQMRQDRSARNWPLRRSRQGYNPALIRLPPLSDGFIAANSTVRLNLQSSGEFMTGSPHSNRAILFCARLSLLFLSLAASFPAMAAAPHGQNEQDVRIRLEWRGDKPENWSGVLETSQGAFANPVSLSTDPDQAGTLWPDGQSVWLGRHSSRPHDGFDVTLRARLARICFTLQTDAQGHCRRQFEWSVAEVGRNPMVFASGDGIAHLSVRRRPETSYEFPSIVPISSTVPLKNSGPPCCRTQIQQSSPSPLPNSNGKSGPFARIDAYPMAPLAAPKRPRRAFDRKSRSKSRSQRRKAALISGFGSKRTRPTCLNRLCRSWCWMIFRPYTRNR